MALRGNFSRDNVGVAQYIGGGALALTMGNLSRAELWRNWASPDGASASLKYAALPTGCYPPVAWRLPITAGELSAHKGLVGQGALAAAIAGGMNGVAVIAGVGDLTAIGELIVSLQAALSGSGTISGAALQAFLNAVATLSGAGDLAAQVTALGALAAVLNGTGDIDAVLTALGALAAQITVTGGALTTANVADAIWNAIATTYNNPGTMGEKLNAASSAGDPWGTALPGAYASGTAGDIVGNMLADLLDNSNVETGLTVRQALRVIAAALAGKVSGAAGTTVTFRNAAADSKDRIVATVDSDGNRTAVTLDVT